MGQTPVGPLPTLCLSEMGGLQALTRSWAEGPTGRCQILSWNSVLGLQMGLEGSRPFTLLI